MSTRTPIITVNNDAGRTFAVRYLPVGARYGRGNSHYVDDAPLVEFWDATLADDNQLGRFGPIGQFVSRYYVDTILGTDGYRYRLGTSTGLALRDGAEVWRIDETALAFIRVWLIVIGSVQR